MSWTCINCLITILKVSNKKSKLFQSCQQIPDNRVILYFKSATFCFISSFCVKNYWYRYTFAKMKVAIQTYILLKLAWRRMGCPPLKSYYNMYYNMKNTILSFFNKKEKIYWKILPGSVEFNFSMKYQTQEWKFSCYLMPWNRNFKKFPKKLFHKFIKLACWVPSVMICN